ncbi:hypothetical protein CTEN210_17410 [Chaetoceros tenuissimus]|uniref:Uncharacterized protein n=1 Tax=Chaetoceros tenuissimus TaxID=426638 RepID=A0AAD3HF73_9STRA|nr:hypothetical protein CTEN210_17410 [Chaetoceros tenuissimus]
MQGYKEIYAIQKDCEILNVCLSSGECVYEGRLAIPSPTLENIHSLPALIQEQHEYLQLREDFEESKESLYTTSLQLVDNAGQFILKELTSDHVMNCIDVELESEFYFEFMTDSIPPSWDTIECVCCKIYDKGVCMILIYFENIFYSILLNAEGADQSLLDEKIPNLSSQGESILLKFFDGMNDDNRNGVKWRSLALWEIISLDSECKETIDVSNDCNCYGQSYIIQCAREGKDPSNRKVLFVFGNWIYSGEAVLIPHLHLEDVNHIIPTLRKQQHQLEFLCYSSDLPKDQTFSTALQKMERVKQIMEREVEMTTPQIEELEAKGMISQEDPGLNFLFQFDCVPEDSQSNDHIMRDIDCIASKSYRPSGVAVIAIYFNGIYYLCLQSAENDISLLDSTFPSLVQERSISLKTYSEGLADWKDLRKLTLKVNQESFSQPPENTTKDTLASSSKNLYSFPNAVHVVVERMTGDSISSLSDKNQNLKGNSKMMTVALPRGIGGNQ